MYRKNQHEVGPPTYSHNSTSLIQLSHLKGKKEWRNGEKGKEGGKEKDPPQEAMDLRKHMQTSSVYSYPRGL